MTAKILSGDIYGALTVLARSTTEGLFECQCICGQVVEVSGGNLVTGIAKSCGISGHKDRLAFKRYSQGKPDLCRGRKYGYLTVLEVPDGGKTRSMITCKCTCGVVKLIRRDYLMSGRTKSCGCMRSSMARSRISLQEANDRLCKENEALKQAQHALLKSRSLRPMQVVGASFGMLTAVAQNKVNPERYNCKCTCGGVRTVALLDLVSGKVTHCNARKHPFGQDDNMRKILADNFKNSMKTQDEIFAERMAAEAAQRTNLQVRK
ncbi:MAG: hypothetical protein ACYC1K_03575 [Minisyncoccota bacterium]